MSEGLICMQVGPMHAAEFWPWGLRGRKQEENDEERGEGGKRGEIGKGRGDRMMMMREREGRKRGRVEIEEEKGERKGESARDKGYSRQEEMGDRKGERQEVRRKLKLQGVRGR